MEFLLRKTRQEAVKVLRLGNQLKSEELRRLANRLFMTAHQIEEISLKRMAVSYKDRELILSLWQEK